jgi:hypothetical protein
MSDPLDVPPEKPKKSDDAAMSYFFVGVALIVTGGGLYFGGNGAGIALAISGLVFVILGIPALKEWDAKRKKR